MNSVIAIGDVHGCYKTLLALIAQLPKDIPIVFLGDLIDRGPDSANVVQFVREGNYACIKGNHEDLMVKATQTGNLVAYEDWKRNGGLYTEHSYTYNNLKMEKDGKWMEKLPLYLDYTFPEGKRLILSHAGVYQHNDNFDESLKHCIATNDIMWHRDALFEEENVYQIVGHTPQKNGPSILDHASYIDTGACYSNRPEYGRLTAMQYPELITYTQNYCE